MQADIYTQSTTRDPDTRQVLREWAFSKTVRCQARPISSEGIRTVGSTEDFNIDYYDEEWVRMRVKKKVSKRDRVRNIRHLTASTSHFKNDDGSAIEFEIMGSQPVLDPFGKTIEYDVLMFKVQDE